MRRHMALQHLQRSIFDFVKKKIRDSLPDIFANFVTAEVRRLRTISL